MQGRVLHGIRRTGFDRCATVDKGCGKLRMAKECGEVERRPAIGVVGFEACGVAIKLGENAVGEAGNRGSEDVELRVLGKKVIGNCGLAVILREKKGSLARWVGGIEQRRVGGKSRAHGRQIALLHVFVKRINVGHV